MSRKWKCSVPGCDAKDQNLFFGVPNEQKESARRKIWVQLLHLDCEKFKTSTKICAKHFDESDILPKRLKQGTNPTRNFPVGYSLSFLCLHFWKLCRTYFSLTNFLRLATHRNIFVLAIKNENSNIYLE